ncbi:p74 [Neodiprion abietis nucleopolyhedrovirus]|uniref:p74 n=1 Tax=Neodiprion abietis nucleopolyhedrovirus TaxID=204507 RepID=Q0ZP30_9CBAC|nr:p74 [Neodiprion abietis nucleopolyhedrovirus]ABC74924.1 p74 [Neodiprion abietis nucleopolyhedrovirus]
MATITAIDMKNASLYATHMSNLKYITRWRNRFPNIFIDYSIRLASNDDYYVPDVLKNKALTVDIAFSEKGCEQINCYPYTETNPINVYTEYGFTQTSDVSVAYGHPACYNIDAASSRKSGTEATVQSMETRYFNDKCIIMDSTAKLWFNSPYVRTSDHVTKGIDDVSGFNVTYNDNDNIPESFSAEFNAAYCDRFGRDVINGACSFQTWEFVVGSILGESIYSTFKMLATGSGKVPFNIDYTHPSNLLPDKPIADAESILNEWATAVDETIDTDFETLFDNYETADDLGLTENNAIVYVAQSGLTKTNVLTRGSVGGRMKTDVQIHTRTNKSSDESLNDIVLDFFNEFPILSSILIDLGYTVIDELYTHIMKKIITKTIPYIEKFLLSSSLVITKRVLGYSIKAALFHQVNAYAVKIASTVAKAIARFSVQASSVIGVALFFLTIVDIILSFCDPYGHSNLFTPDYLAAVALSFLEAFYSQNETRDLIEVTPAHFTTYIDDDDDFMQTFSYLLEYVANLEINSDGQMLNFEYDTTDFVFDSTNLTSIAIAKLSAYDVGDFETYVENFNKIISPTIPSDVYNTYVNGLSFSLALSIVLTIFDTKYIFLTLLLFVLLCVVLYVDIFKFYTNIQDLF